jgi:hypothetical protein
MMHRALPLGPLVPGRGLPRRSRGKGLDPWGMVFGPRNNGCVLRLLIITGPV